MTRAKTAWILLCSVFWLSVGNQFFTPETLAEESNLAEVGNFELRDYLGKLHSLNEYREKKIVVLAFLGTECPLAKLYAGRLESLSQSFHDKNVQFIGLNPNVQDSPTEIAAFARKHDVTFPILKDLGNEVADKLSVKRAPQVIVLDENRAIRYRGKIDDQYSVGVVRDKATEFNLSDAIDAILAGQPIAVAKTEPVGCLIGRVTKSVESTASPVNYCNQIARIFQERCVTCHRDGEIGPFELTDYDEVAGWGDMISEVIEQQRMPPWHANPKYGSFVNDASMPIEERRLVAEWVENGCPKGDPADLPPKKQYTTGWQLPREPDHIIPMSDTAFDVPADGGKRGVPYQYFAVDSGFKKDRWITAAEVQPGNKSVVHHIIVYAQPPKLEGRRHWIFLTAYVPGLRYVPLPPNSAKMIPAESKLIFEMHYTPVGSAQSDISRLGFVFADAKEITHEVLTAEVACFDFRIPPKESDHQVTATSQPIRYSDIKLRSLSPHMHLRGKSFRYELVTTEGERTTLLDVPAYDFNWQTTYVLDEPMPLPKGSVIHCRAAFDNSDENLANPNPNKSITWGDQSWDEMMIGFCDVIVPVKKKRRPARRLVDTGLDVVGIFDETDADGDALLSRKESESKPTVKSLFDLLDSDKNDLLELREALTAIEMMRN